jgi:dihydrofolate reductase
MRVVITENITLDGVVDAGAGWFAPAADDPVDESDVEAELRRHMARQDGLLLGRVTFEEFRGYWPAQADDRTGIRDHLDRVRKYVVSSTLDDPAWEGTTVLRGPLVDEVRALREAPGGDLGITGSISVAHQLIEAGLVDEYRLLVYPVVIGTGRRLFVEGTDRRDLRLERATTFRSGITLLVYVTPDPRRTAATAPGGP